MRAAGHVARRVNFNAGDALYWGLGEAVSWRGRSADLRAFYQQQFDTWSVTDIVLFGDCRPVHRPAIEQARRQGVRVHVFEEGYFRPHCVTLERDGVNDRSPVAALLREPHWPDAPEPRPMTRFPAPFWRRAVHDVIYHLAGLANPLAYPFYRTHAPCAAPIEYAGYIRRLPTLRWHRQRDDAHLKTLLRERRRFYVLPLQMEGDAQIREHSPFADMREVMTRVMRSFARCAPADAVLVVKNHPLDPGLARHGRTARALAHQHGIASRVVYMETGQLPRLLRRAAGVVTVNSTVGTLALEAGLPLMVLGKALYKLPRLAHGGELDTFWMHGARPDTQRFEHFRRLLLARATINGGLYSPQGIALAVRTSLPRLLEGVIIPRSEPGFATSGPVAVPGRLALAHWPHRGAALRPAAPALPRRASALHGSDGAAVPAHLTPPRAREQGSRELVTVAADAAAIPDRAQDVLARRGTRSAEPVAAPIEAEAGARARSRPRHTPASAPEQVDASVVPAES